MNTVEFFISSGIRWPTASHTTVKTPFVYKKLVVEQMLPHLHPSIMLQLQSRLYPIRYNLVIQFFVCFFFLSKRKNYLEKNIELRKPSRKFQKCLFFLSFFLKKKGKILGRWGCGCLAAILLVLAREKKKRERLFFSSFSSFGI